MREQDSMHEVAPIVGNLRRRLGRLLPRSWRSSSDVSGGGLRPRRPARARMELVPDAPAQSWAAWEISRAGRPVRQ